jgi:hypothetical protein
MLSSIVKEKLRQKIKFCFSDTLTDDKSDFIVKDEDRKFFKEEMGVVNVDSAFVDYYTIVAFPPAGNGDELLTLDDILTVMEEGGEPEIKGMDNFIRFSSIEGEASYFYNKVTDEVFDVAWGEEEAMVAGKLAAIHNSFSDFLNWYYS